MNSLFSINFPKISHNLIELNLIILPHLSLWHAFCEMIWQWVTKRSIVIISSTKFGLNAKRFDLIYRILILAGRIIVFVKGEGGKKSNTSEHPSICDYSDLCLKGTGPLNARVSGYLD